MDFADGSMKYVLLLPRHFPKCNQFKCKGLSLFKAFFLSAELKFTLFHCHAFFLKKYSFPIFGSQHEIVEVDFLIGFSQENSLKSSRQ